MAETFPRRFGRYALIEHLAQGGMGSLYLAYQGDAGFEKLCVIKTVLRELADREYVARFRDEAKVVVRLSHGNLVPVFDAGAVDGELYIAMDYVDGRDLRAVWNKCAEKGVPFPVDVAVYIVKELCRGLHHAHALADLKLVHRDVSPPNVLLSYSGEVKLTDFGLAHSALKLQHTMPGIVYGKVSYMAPEQARGELLDGRADLYALGVILWELLTGRQLFPNTDGNAIERVRSPEVSRPSLRASRVPLALDPLVMKALAPDRQLRYADAEGFRAALAAFLAREAPTIDTARVATFQHQLFGEEIEADRKRRKQLVQEARRKLARSTLELNRAVLRPGSGPVRAVSPGAATAPVGGSLPPGGEMPGDFHLDGVSDKDVVGGMIGTVIDGRYRVSRLIGEGGMGRVYEAEHVDIGRRVAVKVLHPMWSRYPELVARFRREARAASVIGHPNIIDVTDSGTTATGAVYFVMEYLEGSDLAAVVHREKALAVERVTHIGAQLARALQAAHTAGVIHRDLKPENVFLISRGGQTDIVKVLDFGIARQLESETSKPRLTQPNMAMGTPQYMSPETALGRPADARSDVYGVGAILYEMLIGHPPLEGQSNEEILQRKLNEVPATLAQVRGDVPRELSECVATALARDPAMRQQTMGQLAEELERCRPERRRTGRERRIRGADRPVAQYVAVGGGVVFLAAAGALVLRLGQPVVPQAGRPSGVKPESAGRVGERSSRGATPAPRRDPAPAEPSAPIGGPALGGGARATPSSGAEQRRPEGPATSAPPPPPPATPPRATIADPRRALDEANRLLREHRLSEAEQAFARLLNAGVERSAAATGYARVAFEQSRYDAAVRRGEQAVKAGGGLEARRILGAAYFKEQKWDAAIREWGAVLKARPEDADARKHLDMARAKRDGG